MRSLATARFCRILGTLLHNGVPILNSLRIAKDASGNMVLAERSTPRPTASRKEKPWLARWGPAENSRTKSSR